MICIRRWYWVVLDSMTIVSLLTQIARYYHNLFKTDGYFLEECLGPGSFWQLPTREGIIGIPLIEKIDGIKDFKILVNLIPFFSILGTTWGKIFKDLIGKFSADLLDFHLHYKQDTINTSVLWFLFIELRNLVLFLDCTDWSACHPVRTFATCR